MFLLKINNQNHYINNISFIWIIIYINNNYSISLIFVSHADLLLNFRSLCFLTEIYRFWTPLAETSSSNIHKCAIFQINEQVRWSVCLRKQNCVVTLYESNHIRHHYQISHDRNKTNAALWVGERERERETFIQIKSSIMKLSPAGRR